MANTRNVYNITKVKSNDDIKFEKNNKNNIWTKSCNKFNTFSYCISIKKQY